MGSLLDDIRDGIRDGIELFVDKTEEYTKVGKLNIEILGLKRNIEKMFADIGGRAYEYFKTDTSKKIATDKEILGLVDSVKQLEQKLQAKKQEIEQVKQEKERERKERDDKRKAEKDAEPEE